MNIEQREQLILFIEALKRDFYHPIDKIELCGFKTKERFLLKEAERHEKTPFEEGFEWGGMWDYAWMFGKFKLPESVKGERIVMNLKPGGESTVFINGTPFGTCRGDAVVVPFHPHHYISDQILTSCAEGGEAYELAMEVYGGTPALFSPTGNWAGGPVFPEEGVIEKKIPPAVLGECTYGIWCEEAYQLWLDVTVLLDVHDSQDEDSFLKEKIGYLFDEMLDIVDIEVPFGQRREAYNKARTILAPAINAKNGSIAPSVGVIANSHLDVVWLWTLEETRRKVIRTFAQQLRMLEEYPEAKFVQSQCVLYDMLHEQYPEMFDDIKKAIARGQWIAEGAAWVEPDTNLAGGEALIRQFLYGKQYFMKEFGIDSKIAWLPDSFGYSGVLPQILAGCEVDGLTTQKIFWSYNDVVRFPYHSFIWKGMDGTEISCYLHMSYSSAVDVKTIKQRWHDRLTKDGTGNLFQPFGYGDGGGGPTRDDFEHIRRAKDIQGVPKLYYETPNELLERCKKNKLPVYCGELYFPCHRGTYTTQALIKKYNRTAEQLMRAYELWAACGQWQEIAEYPMDEIEKRWKQVLLNQFHDIIPGSSIAEVYTDAIMLYQELFEAVNKNLDNVLDRFPSDKNGVTLYHDQSYEKERIVLLDSAYVDGAKTLEGEDIPCMQTAEGVLALVKLPSMGSVSVYPAATAKMNKVKAVQCGKGYVLTNDKLRVVLNEKGEVTELTDIATGKKRIGSISNQMHLYRDLPRAFDAWDIDSQTENREIPMNAAYTSEIVLEEGLRASVQFVASFRNSKMIQTVSLDAGADRIDFNTYVDWHETHKLLKVFFDTGVQATEAANQMQFGYFMRPTHKSNQFDRDRFEVCNHCYTAIFDANHGAAVLNDSKYGVSMDYAQIGLSLLRGAVNPDPNADQGEHTFRYAYYIWDGAFDKSGIVQEASVLNAPVHMTKGISAKKSYFSVDEPNIIIETVKLAEDGSGDMIVRLYESMNGTRSAVLTTAFDVKNAWKCNMLEKIEKEVSVIDHTISLEFTPFEIKTLRLSRK